jgi:hypothetical protein
MRNKVPAVDEPAPSKKLIRRKEWNDSDDEDGKGALNRLFQGIRFSNYRRKNR